MPSNGISTNKALDALRYCRVSTVLAERSFVMSTCANNCFSFPFVVAGYQLTRKERKRGKTGILVGHFYR